MKFTKKQMILLACIAVAVLLLIAVAGLILEYNGTNKKTENVIVSIPEGASGSQITEALKDRGIIANKTLFKLVSKLSGRAEKFKHGTYKLSASMGYSTVMGILSGEIEGEVLNRITIPEGYEFRMIADKLMKDGIVGEDFIKAAEELKFEYDFIKALPDRENKLEGYLFPETYFVNEGATPEMIIDIMLKQFDKEFTPEYKKRAEELDMTIDEVVTLASVIQREAQNEAEMPLVSSVFHNRLKNKTYPYLESCATVQYILKERKPVLSVADTKINSPYNTYINKGLPAGPIASPGRAAIHAALYPEDSNYMFFVLGKDGRHIFSETYEEHLKAANGG